MPATSPFPKVTRAMLARAGACDEELRLFARTYPEGIRVTVHSIRAAKTAGLNLTWYFNRLARIHGKEYRAAQQAVSDFREDSADMVAIARDLADSEPLVRVGLVEGKRRFTAETLTNRLRERMIERMAARVIIATAAKIAKRKARAKAKR